LSGPFSGLQLT